MDIEERIARMIVGFECDNYGRKPSMIVMHPETYRVLIESINLTVGGFTWYNNGNVYKFMGVDVLRSLDLEENEIRV